MDKSSITPGRHYAIREHPSEALQRVKILESVRRGKWRAEWVNPNPGLVDYIESRNIIVAWSERRAFLRDERNAESLSPARWWGLRDAFPGVAQLSASSPTR